MDGGQIPSTVSSKAPGPGGSRSSGAAKGAASHRARGIACALAAAVMFGASTPFVRPALAHTDSAASAGYLYLGQAILLFPLWLAGRARRWRKEAGLGRRDAGPLLLGIVAGGGDVPP